MKLSLLLSVLGLAQGSFLRRADGDFELTILHTNDIHSHYAQNNKYGTDCTPDQIAKKVCYGGMARIKTAVDDLRKQHANSLLLDGGDQFQGTMFYTYYKGNTTVDFMNYIGYDVMTVGNHEFDNGPENLGRVIKDFKFPVVSANLDVSKEPSLNGLVKPYKLFPEYKVAVIGFITYTAPSISNLGNNIIVNDPIESVQKAINEVKALGYNRIIGVSHNGYSEDQELARKTKGLSLIVGGHSHSYLAAANSNVTGPPVSLGLYPTKVNNLDNRDTYVVQAYCWGRFLGHVDIKFDNTGYLSSIEGAPIELNDSILKNQEADDLIQKWREPFDAFSKQVIGFATDVLDETKCQDEECSLGSFISDVMLDKRPESDFSFINAGGIRASIAKGNITNADVLTVSPFGGALTDIKLTGQQIWNMLEAVVSKVNVLNNKPVTSFIQVGGLKFTYDPTQPPQSRMVSVQIKDPKNKGKFLKLDLTKTYTGTTLDFLANGGDNMIAAIKEFAILETTDAVITEFIKKNTPVSPYLDGRIKIVKKGDPTTDPTDKPTKCKSKSKHGYPTTKPTQV